MKKMIVFAGLMLVSVIAKAQTFEIKRMIASGYSIKMKGKIIVTDSTLTFDYANEKLGDVVMNIVPVETLTTDKVTQHMFMASGDLAGKFDALQGSTRVLLTTTENGQNQSLKLDSKDNFTGQITTSMWLIKNEE